MMMGEDIPIKMRGGNMNTISDNVVPNLTLIPRVDPMIHGPVKGMIASKAPAAVKIPETRYRDL
jgi:hypothetical protein